MSELARGTNANEAAFPYEDWEGLSFREYLAARCLEGLLSYHGAGYDVYQRPEDQPGWSSSDATDEYVQMLRAKQAARRLENKAILAREAVAYADALVTELQKGGRE